jgi:putative membrane protein
MRKTSMAAESKSQPTLSDVLAAERTFLAWIRTGLALMGFGFVVARFGLFLKQIEFLQHSEPKSSYGLSLWFGTVLIVLGVLVNLLSAWHHLHLVRQLNRGGPVPSRPSTQAVLLALFLAINGLAMAIYLMFTH